MRLRSAAPQTAVLEVAYVLACQPPHAMGSGQGAQRPTLVSH